MVGDLSDRTVFEVSRVHIEQRTCNLEQVTGPELDTSVEVHVGLDKT